MSARTGTAASPHTKNSSGGEIKSYLCFRRRCFTLRFWTGAWTAKLSVSREVRRGWKWGMSGEIPSDITVSIMEDWKVHFLSVKTTFCRWQTLQIVSTVSELLHSNVPTQMTWTDKNSFQQQEKKNPNPHHWEVEPQSFPLSHTPPKRAIRFLFILSLNTCSALKQLWLRIIRDNIWKHAHGDISWYSNPAEVRPELQRRSCVYDWGPVFSAASYYHYKVRQQAAVTLKYFPFWTLRSGTYCRLGTMPARRSLTLSWEGEGERGFWRFSKDVGWVKRACCVLQHSNGRAIFVKSAETHLCDSNI